MISTSCNVAFSHNYNYNFNLISYFKTHLTINRSIFVSQAEKGSHFEVSQQLTSSKIAVKDLCLER